MGRVYWVDNTNGDDIYTGSSYEFPVETIDRAIDLINLNGTPGDTIRICYTGQDYTMDTPPSYISTARTAGTSWSEGEYFTIEGHDPDGGYNRPILDFPPGGVYKRAFQFTQYADYWKITDLHFRQKGANTSWSSYPIFFYSGLYDDLKYFKVTRCAFEGWYGEDSADTWAGIRAYGARLDLEVSYCYVTSSRYFISTSNTAPYFKNLHMHHCLVYDAPYARASSIYNGQAADSTTEDSTFNFHNNTQYGSQATQWTGQFVTIVTNGSFGLDDTFITRNNICLRVNYFLRATVGNTFHSGLADRSDVGYNTWGYHNRIDQGYYNDADVFELSPDYTAHGDIYILNGDSSSKDDVTSWFKGYGDNTYFWEDSGWMTIPDMRPTHADFTGTYDGNMVDYAGIRGAIPYSGIYNDATITVSSSAVIYPYIRPNLIPEYSIDDIDLGHFLLDYNRETGAPLIFDNVEYLTFTGFGNIQDYSCQVIDSSEVANRRYYTLRPEGHIYPNTDTTRILIGNTQLKVSGETEVEGAWSGWDMGDREQSIIKQTKVVEPTHYIRKRRQDPNTGEISDWVTIDSY